MVGTYQIVELMKFVVLVAMSFTPPTALSASTRNSVDTSRIRDYGTTEVWISPNARKGKGKGTQAEPLDAHTQAAFQSVIDTVPANSTIRMVDGVYPKMSLTIRKGVTLSGSRKAVITQASGTNHPIFALSGVDTDFTLEGISLEHGTAFMEENNVAAILGGCRKLRVTDIYSSDFNNTIYITDALTQEVDVERCQFEYTYGRASVSNVAPYDHPCAAIAGTPKRLIVRNNRFNGLLDPTFAHASPNVPESQKQAADNFVQTGNHDFCLVEGNNVSNFGIEGIFIARDKAAGDYAVRITNNNMIGSVFHNQTYSPVYAPGIKVQNSKGEIVANTISNTNIGISAEFSRYDEGENIIQISQNSVNHCLLGIEGIRISGKSIASRNSVWNSSEPVRSVWGPRAVPTELYGIVADHGNVIGNKLVSDEPIWDAKTVLLARSGVVFTVASASDINANTGALISYANGGFAAFPVRQVSGNRITVDSTFANTFSNVTDGPLLYTRSFANGLSNGGIVVRSGGTIYADGNVIVGHRNDISQQISGSIVASHHTARDCHVTRSNTPGLFLIKP
ncbi:MAG TPA: hypothetical protein VEI58_12275 [Chthoniobacterales bacterium]|nr:hypothetical protein [Chthoniobacterales bacterium]